MKTNIKFGMPVFALFGSIAAASHARAADAVAVLPNAPAERSLVEGQPFNAVAWMKAIDTEISSLNSAKDNKQIEALGLFRQAVDQEQQKDAKGDHQDVKDALQKLRQQYPEQADHIVKDLNKHIL